ncbi:Serine/threonine-protein kinase Doa [Sarcoptes scabiei]|nr:Serine/threonine-protein kinase Doa [Sarcoptes scabiei]
MGRMETLLLDMNKYNQNKLKMEISNFSFAKITETETFCPLRTSNQNKTDHRSPFNALMTIMKVANSTTTVINLAALLRLNSKQSQFSRDSVNFLNESSFSISGFKIFLKSEIRAADVP